MTQGVGDTAAEEFKGEVTEMPKHTAKGYRTSDAVFPTYEDEDLSAAGRTTAMLASPLETGDLEAKTPPGHARA